MTAGRFRRLPLEVDAILFDPDRTAEVTQWVLDRGGPAPLPNDGSLWVISAEGLVQVPPGWWLVHGPDGEWSAVRRERFARLYEEV